MKAKEQLYIIGYNLFLSDKRKIIYNIMIYGEKIIPVMKKKSILFCDDIEMLLEVMKYADLKIEKYKFDKNVALVCDIIDVFDKIKFKNIDRNASIINCLNMLDDLLISVNKKNRSKYDKLIDDFANHLTFHRRYDQYIEKNNIERNNLIDGINSVLKKILSSSKLITREKGKNVIKKFPN